MPTHDAEQEAEHEHRGLNRKMFGKLVIIAVFMFGFGYALIPVYKQVCEALGINVLTQKDGNATLGQNTQVDKSRTITVEFDSNTTGPMRFRPVVNSMQVHPGELSSVIYEVVNTQARTVHAQAIPSYAPQSAMPHFKKVECFCFTQQTLKANEARQMPVVFFVDKDLPRDVKTITLSYTFFDIPGLSQAELKSAVK